MKTGNVPAQARGKHSRVNKNVSRCDKIMIDQLHEMTPWQARL